ncbi:MAG TPA: CHAT domain-containing protein [Pyrinomonadaceae bacterium]|jgi:CHAT domain-containing protein
MSKSQIPLITRAVQQGVRWLKEYAEELTDARDIAICISALVTAERNPHSQLVQRLASSIIRQQALNGSWNEELWDTVWATKALYDVGYEINSREMHAALRFLEATQDTLTGTWYEEPFETMLVLDLLARIVPEKLVSLSERSLKWLASLQKSDGAIIGIRYTGMIASLFCLTKRVGVWNSQRVTELALKYIRQDLGEKSIWTSAAWSNYYPLMALLDYGATLDDSFVSKAVDWFLASQDTDGKWMQVSRVHDTAMSVLVLSNLLTTPLVDISDPRTGILSINRENGTIRVSFHGPGTGAITPAEKIKISSHVRADLSQNQQLMMATMKPVRGKRSTIIRKNQVEAPVQAEITRSGRYAYGHLIPAKIQLLLETSLADHLRFDIDERLIDLPWELIHDGTEFICLRYAMGRRLISDQNFLPPRRQPRFVKETRVMIVANPTNDLPAAKKEGRKVAQLLRDKCAMQVDEFTSSDITKKDFLLSLKDYDIVHFAGHASYDARNPDESCLIFSDGEIQAFEIARFITNRAPIVVFLNACWSAEELRNPDLYSPMMRGLGRTFLYAGVSAFIGYLVPVPDDSATQFAISFYESLAQGQTIGESMRRARIEARNLKIPDDLTYLSAVLYGDPAVRAIDSTK